MGSLSYLLVFGVVAAGFGLLMTLLLRALIASATVKAVIFSLPVG